jgi:hypothetical protein
MEATLPTSKKLLRSLCLLITLSRRYKKREIRKEGRKTSMVASLPSYVPYIRYTENVVLDKIGLG